MLIFTRKTTDSLLFSGITPSNISNDLKKIVHGRRYLPNTLQFYSDKLIRRRDYIEFN